MTSPATAQVEFALSIDDGTPTLRLENRELFGWVRLDRLELEVPTRGAAVDPRTDPLEFRTRRTVAVAATMRMEQSDLDAFCAARGTTLADSGIDELSLRAMDGYLSLGARVRARGHVAEITARLLAGGDENHLRIAIDEARSYGFLPEPAPLVAYRTVAAMLGVSTERWATAVGLAEFDVEPIAALLWNTLPRAGWRLPDTHGLRAGDVRCRPGEVTIAFATERRSRAAASDPLAEITANLDAFRPADELFRDRETAAALRAYRAELNVRGSEHPFLVERILSIASTDRDYFVDALELARAALGRWPDFAPAHNALANIASAENDGVEAAHRFQILANSHALVGDDEAAAKAALAGARLLRRLSPAESTPLYELVLEHSPDESEAAEALAERYREENRWSDLIGLIRARVGRASDPIAAARDHIRLARILSDALGDPRGAREELRAAIRLDPHSGPAHETLADIELALDNSSAAIAELDEAASLYSTRNDTRGMVRSLLAAADLAERAGDDAQAERRYRATVDRVPNEPAALRGAAGAAARQGQFAEAAELWRMLLLSCADSALAQAECSYELGRCLLSDGDVEGARPALERAARSGPALIAAEAHALLAKIYQLEDQPQAAAIELAASITSLTRAASEQGPGASSPPVRLRSRAAEHSLERAGLLAAMNQTEGAQSEYQRAFELGEDRLGVRRAAAEALLAAAERSGDQPARKRWLGALLESEPADEMRRGLLLRRARLRLETDGDPEGADSDLTEALAGDNEDLLTRDALGLKAEIARLRGQGGVRAEALAARATLSSESDAASAWIEAAQAWLEADRAGEAQAAAEKALDDFADHGGLDESELVAAHLARVEGAWRQRRYQQVGESTAFLLERAAAGAGALASRVVELRFRAAVSRDRRGLDEEAVSGYLEVTDDADADPALRIQALRQLAELYERLGRYESAAEKFSLLASDPRSALPTSARADAWYRAAELYRKHQGRSADAERCLEETLKLVADHMPALDALETLKRDTDDYERVAVILGRKIAATARHPGRQKSLLVRLAALQDDVLSRQDVARQTYQRALEIDPLYRPAVRFAAADANRQGRVTEAAELYSKLAGHLPDDLELPDDPAVLSAERARAALDLAEIARTNASEQSIVDLAAVALEHALAEADDPTEIAVAIEEIARKTRDWRTVTDRLGDPGRSTLARDLERVEILWRQLDDPTAALVAARSARDRHPDEELLREYEEALEELTAITDSATNPGFAQEVAESLAAARKSRARGEVTAALAHLERIAGPAAPDDMLTLRAELREESGQWERAAHDLTLLRRRAASAGDLSLEHRLCRKLATLTAEKLGDGMTALALYERALELDQDDLAAAEACVALFERRGDRAARATALERVVSIARRSGASAQTEVGALRDLAHYALSEGRAGRALERLEEALERVPGDEPTLRQLAQVHADRGDVTKQSETLRILAGTLTDRAGGSSASAGELYLELADVYYDSLEQVDKARESMLVAARAFGPGSRSRSILRLLASEASGDGDNDTVIRALENIAEDDLGEADVIMLAKAYQRAARDQRAVSTLEQARARGRLSDEGALLLLALYRQLGRKRELAHSLEGGSRDAPPAIASTRLQEALGLYQVTLENESAADRVRKRLTELAHVHQITEHDGLVGRPGPEELERAAEAAAAGAETAVGADLLARALAQRTEALIAAHAGVDDATRRTLENLRSLARRDHHFEALARGLLIVSSIETGAASSELLREAATITRRHLHDTRGAADLLSRALALAPDDATLCEDLDATLREAGDYSQLVSAYELHLGAVSGRRRAQPLIELARLYRDVFEEPARARNYLANAIEVAPELEGELDRELGELERAVTSESGEGGTLPAAPRIVVDADDSASTPRHSRERSVDELLAKATELEADDQVNAAIAQCERAAARPGGDRRPLATLERLYAARDDWGAVSEVLGRLAATAEDGSEAAAIWYRRANLYRDVLHREPEAYRCLKEAHVNDPSNGTIANSLRAVAMARGEWALAAELLYREIAAAEDSDVERGALYLELALIYDEKLLDVDAAMVNYEQALAYDPEIPAAPKPLGRLYELRGRYDEAAEMYELAAARARTEADRGRLLRHAALSAEHAGEANEARRLYSLAAVAGSTEDHEKAQLALARLGGSPKPGVPEGATDARVRLLEARLGETEDAETAKDLRLQLLELAHTRGNASDEMRHARSLLADDRTDVSAYVALKSRAAQAGDWQQVASLLSSRAAAVGDVGERANLYYELGRAYKDDLGDRNAAVGAFEQALAADPDHAGALEALAEITYHKHDWIRAYPIYQRLVPEKCSMPADVIALRQGEIAEALGREAEACDAFAEAVRLFPASRTALEALARTSKRVGDLKRAVSATRALLELAPPSDVGAATRARSELASLLSRTGDITGAIYYYELVVGEEPKAANAVAELVALYSEKGDFHGAARCTRALIALTPDADRRADLLFRLGEIYREPIGDADLAADAYLKGVDLAPNHVPILRRLLEYYFRVGDGAAMIDVARDLERNQALTRDETGKLHLGRLMVLAAARGEWELVGSIANWFGIEREERLVQSLIDVTAQQRDSWPPTLVSAAGAAICSHLGIDGRTVFQRVSDFATSGKDADAAAALLEALSH